MTVKKYTEAAIKAFQADAACNGRKTNTSKIRDSDKGCVVSLKRDGVTLAEYAFNGKSKTPVLLFIA